MDTEILLDLFLKWSEDLPFVQRVSHKEKGNQIVFRMDINGRHFEKLQFLRQVDAPEAQILTVEIDQQVSEEDLITLRIRATFQGNEVRLEYALGKTPDASGVDIFQLGKKVTDLFKGGQRQTLVPRLNLSPITRENNFRGFDNPELLKLFT